MTGTADAIMDAAERRIRVGGYGGFSFRDVASDIGVKSASVHYHFPTKDDLAAAVARRYTDRFTQAVADEIAAGTGVQDAWRDVFRRSLAEDGRMCLCGILGAGAHGLSEQVAAEVRRFFRSGLEGLEAGGLGKEEALRFLAMLEGSMLVASVLGDQALFDAASAPAAAAAA